MDITKVDRDVAYVAMICTHMLLVLIPNVSSIFRTYVTIMCYLDVAYVSHICCKCFIWMLCMFAIVSSIFSYFSSVLDACFKLFICLLLYVVSVASGCFKSRWSIVHEMRVGSSWRCGGHPKRRGRAARALARCTGSFSCAQVSCHASAPDKTSGR
jgi:hypothetical protein